MATVVIYAGLHGMKPTPVAAVEVRNPATANLETVALLRALADKWEQTTELTVEDVTS